MVLLRDYTVLDVNKQGKRIQLTLYKSSQHTIVVKRNSLCSHIYIMNQKDVNCCKTFDPIIKHKQQKENRATWNDNSKYSIHIFNFAQISVSVLDVIMQGMAFQEPPRSDTVLVQVITASKGK